MKKGKIRVGPYLYPMPVVLIGSLVRKRPNFMPIAWTAIVEHNPAMILISANQNHFTNEGIKENKTFSVNFTSVDMVRKTDYCGLKSGKNCDKSGIFKVFYGELKTAPMIEESPVNLECTVDQLIDNGRGHDIIIGEIKNAFSEDKYLTNGIPDVKKFNPLIFTMNDNNYWSLGDYIGRAWSIGKEYEQK
ncbi:MAG: flavin reductase family protein [Candidatus Lokiarchaeota archaeon]